MSQVQTVQEDLRYVRDPINRRDGQRPPGSVAIYYVWAVYTLVGYALIDFAPYASGPFFGICGLIAGALSAAIGYKATRQSGEWDVARRRRVSLHWMGGPLLALIATFALASVIPPLREKTYSGQVAVVMIGIVYFLGGVHFDRSFLWLGPVLIVGGIVVGAVPHYGWTTLGAVIAAGLVVPTLFSRRHADAPPAV